MFEAIANFWDQHGFDILLILSVVFLIIYTLTRIGKKGTYDTSVNISSSNAYIQEPRRRPKESKGETICRNYLEKTFGKAFAKSRPRFLNNPVTGGEFNLELDGYNSELGLAFEYQGQQHYKYVPYFHKNKEAFYNQKYRDYMKRVMCKDNGIKLIEVPYDVKHCDIEEYMKKELVKLGFM
jgi:hypothetical protein